MIIGDDMSLAGDEKAGSLAASFPRLGLFLWRGEPKLLEETLALRQFSIRQHHLCPNADADNGRAYLLNQIGK